MSGGHRQRLRIEEVGQQREEAQEEHHHGVAPRAQLQRLERQQHDDQRHARIAPDDGAVRHQREQHRQRQQHGRDPACWQGPPAAGQPAAPGQQRGRHGAGPGRYVGGQRRDAAGYDGQQEQRVARLARQAGEAACQVHGWPPLFDM